ncbi:cation transporter, partial [Flavobacteriaceae bacterium AH-315-B10]|nr:cation transporter [Flavobacteriaceae bacterium AH-315-B10]
GVRGNCGMCKATIEKAANSIEGVSSAVWDKDNKKIDVSYNASKTNLKAIHNAIAASGYDTDNTTADQEKYNNLPGCCKYDKEMKMNVSAKKKDDHNGHKH